MLDSLHLKNVEDEISRLRFLFSEQIHVSQNKTQEIEFRYRESFYVLNFTESTVLWIFYIFFYINL